MWKIQSHSTSPGAKQPYLRHLEDRGFFGFTMVSLSRPGSFFTLTALADVHHPNDLQYLKLSHKWRVRASSSAAAGVDLNALQSAIAKVLSSLHAILHLVSITPD